MADFKLQNPANIYIVGSPWSGPAWTYYAASSGPGNCVQFSLQPKVIRADNGLLQSTTQCLKFDPNSLTSTKYNISRNNKNTLTVDIAESNGNPVINSATFNGVDVSSMIGSCS